MAYDPLSTALKFGFLAVLFLFLLVIARSAFRDLRRTAAPAPDATGFHAAPGYAEVQRGVDAWLVAESLAQLSEEHRQVIVRAYYGRRTVTDIAEELDIPSGTVKSRLHYGLRALKLALQEKGVTSQ